MPLFKTQGIVLRSFNLSETDKLITFMTAGYGKVKGVAKGARRMKSRFGASLEPLTQVSLIYFGKENQELYRLNHCDILGSCQDLLQDPSRYYSAVYFCELMDAMTGEGQVERKLFSLLEGVLAELKGNADPDILCRLYELRLLAGSGYKPRLDNCLVCHKLPDSPQVGFSYHRQGIVCQSCFDREPVEYSIHTGTLNYLKKLLTLDMRHAGRLKIPESTGLELEQITHRLVQSRLGRELKSYPFIRQMATLF